MAGDETGAQGDYKNLESTASANNIGQRQEVVKSGIRLAPIGFSNTLIRRCQSTFIAFRSRIATKEQQGPFDGSAGCCHRRNQTAVIATAQELVSIV